MVSSKSVITTTSSSAQTPCAVLGAGEVDLGMVHLVARVERLGAHRTAQEVDDRVAALERVTAAAVRRHGVGA